MPKRKYDSGEQWTDTVIEPLRSVGLSLRRFVQPTKLTKLMVFQCTSTSVRTQSLESPAIYVWTNTSISVPSRISATNWLFYLFHNFCSSFDGRGRRWLFAVWMAGGSQQFVLSLRRARACELASSLPLALFISNSTRRCDFIRFYLFVLSFEKEKHFSQWSDSRFGFYNVMDSVEWNKHMNTDA